MKKEKFLVKVLIVCMSFMISLQSVCPIFVANAEEQVEQQETTETTDETDSIDESSTSGTPRFISVGSMVSEDETIWSFTENVETPVQTMSVEDDSAEETLTADVLGIVYDIDTGDMLSNATVTFTTLGRSVVTDAEGRFAFAGVPVGDYDVTVSCDDYVGSIFSELTVSYGVGTVMFSLCLSQNYDINEGVETNGSQSSVPFALTSNGTSTAASTDTVKLAPIAIEYNGTVYALDYQEYLYHVVGGEIGSYNNDSVIEFFKAQAIAARTAVNYYANYGNPDHEDDIFTMCSKESDSVKCCQRFNPYETTSVSVNAVDATKNQIMVDKDNNSLFYSSYFSACTGNTCSSKDRWGNVDLHLLSKPCNVHTPNDAEKDDLPHMVGMCQEGAYEMAKANKTCSEILNYYYTNIKIVTAECDEYEYLSFGKKVLINGSATAKLYVNEHTVYYFLVNSSKNNPKIALIQISPDENNSEIIIEEHADKIGDSVICFAHLDKGIYNIYMVGEGVSVSVSDIRNGCDIENTIKLYNNEQYFNFMWNAVLKSFIFIPESSAKYVITTLPTSDVSILRDDRDNTNKMSLDTTLKIINYRTGKLIANNNDISADNSFSSVTVFLEKGEVYSIVVADNGNNEEISCLLEVYNDDFRWYNFIQTNYDLVNTACLVATAYDTEYVPGKKGEFNNTTQKYQFDYASLIWNLYTGEKDTTKTVDQIFENSCPNPSDDMSTIMPGEMLYMPGSTSKSAIYIGSGKIVTCDNGKGVYTKAFVGSEWKYHGQLEKVVYNYSDSQIKEPASQICQATYANGTIEVTLAGYSTDQTWAWVGVYPENQTSYGSDYGKAKVWHKIDDVVNTMTVEGPRFDTKVIRMKYSLDNPQNYKVVYFNDGYYLPVSSNNEIRQLTYLPDRTIEEGTNTTITPITLEKTTYAKNEIIPVSFSGVTNKDAWIGLYPAGTTDYDPCSMGMWCYTSTGTQWGISSQANTVNSGTVSLKAEYRDVYTGYIPEEITPGRYVIVLFGDNGHTKILATKIIRIE